MVLKKLLAGEERKMQVSVKWYAAGFLASVFLLSTAYFYFEKQLGLPPCPLCMFQRLFVAGIGFVCLIGLIQQPKGILNRVFAFLISVFSLMGLYVAARHAWLQSLPAELVPECGPDLEFMLQAFPIMETIKTVLSGSGECADVQWSWLGLSMPEWMIVVFMIMFIIGINFLFKKERRYFMK